MTTPTYHESDDQLAKRVFERIDREGLVPRPRWEFLFKNYFFWGFGALAVLFGALAFSATLFEIENVDWRFASVTHNSFIAFFFDAAPILWVCLFALFILIGYLNIRRTNHGYRYSLTLIAFGAVLTSLALGTALYASGFGGMLEDAAGAHIPFHRSVLLAERSWWLAPGRGLISGQVVSVAPDTSSFILRDFKGILWQVATDDLRIPDLATVVRGGMVRVVGVPVTATSSIFHACFVLPWPTRESLPPPLATIASTSERDSTFVRSELCKGIRPYTQLRALDETGF